MIFGFHSCWSFSKSDERCFLGRVMSFIEKSVARLDQLERLETLALELGKSHYRYNAPPKYYGVNITSNTSLCAWIVLWPSFLSTGLEIQYNSVILTDICFASLCSSCLFLHSFDNGSKFNSLVFTIIISFLFWLFFGAWPLGITVNLCEDLLFFLTEDPSSD